MATIKQKKLAQAIVENAQSDNPITTGQMLENVGYATSVAEHKPKEIIEAKGVQQELKRLGFDEESAKDVVAEILKYGEDDSVRLRAASEIFKVFGTYAAEKSFNMTVNTSVDELNNVIRNDLARFRSNQ